MPKPPKTYPHTQEQRYEGRGRKDGPHTTVPHKTQRGMVMQWRAPGGYPTVRRVSFEWHRGFGRLELVPEKYEV